MPVYLDHAAGGPLHPAAAAAMAEWQGPVFGNPSGSHSVARRARAAVEDAREVVARFLGVDPGGVVFTSGGTEADNLAVLGSLPPLVPAMAGPPAAAVVVGATEHPAVLEAAAAGPAGYEVRVIGVGPDGTIDPGAMRDVLDPGVALVSIQTANHETGVVQPLDRLAGRIRKWAPRAVFHTDAVQAAPWLDLPAVTAGADLVTISGHKVGGPQGVGAVGLRSGATVRPIIHGGGQERERRSGTHNVAGIVGMAAALEVVAAGRAAAGARVGRLRDLLSALITEEVPGSVRTAPAAALLPGHCHFRFPGVESEALLFLLDEDGVCASAGAACASGALEPSPVLMAMGVDKSEAASALRLTLGPDTTEADVRAAAGAVGRAVARLGSA